MTRRLILVILAAILAWPSAADARVRKIVVEKKVSPASDGAAVGPAGPYETLAGRAFGELDPNDPRNAIITDITLAPRNARGMVEYVASFFLAKPIDMSKSSSAGTSSPRDFTRERSATTPRAWSPSREPRRSAWRTATRGCRSRSGTPITLDTSKP